MYLYLYLLLLLVIIMGFLIHQNPLLWNTVTIYVMTLKDKLLGLRNVVTDFVVFWKVKNTRTGLSQEI